MSTGADPGPDRCPAPCGKLRLSKSAAKATARRLREQRDDEERRMTAYPHAGAWHVGHTDGWRKRAARRERIRRREALDRYDKNV
jgi:hypothetical protein